MAFGLLCLTVDGIDTIQFDRIAGVNMQNQNQVKQQYLWALLTLGHQSAELRTQRERVQLLEELVSDLSHDVRTPLSNIQTCLYILKKSPSPEKQQHYFNNLEAQVQRLSKLVEDILATLRLSKDSPLKLVPTNLNALIGTLVDVCYHRVEVQELRLGINLSTDLPLVLADEIKLARALSNLIENALTYTPRGGSITIRTYPQENDVIVEIIDTGIGITYDDQSRIFERFYRTDKARETNENGTGLGLAIVTRIIELHNGQIEVESEQEKGSIFSIRLPAMKGG
jgi:signal transduction histidine kinase